MGSALTETTLAHLSYSKPRITLEEKMKQAAPEALDLVKRLVVFNPADRLTAEECLEHPYLAQFHAPHREIVAHAKVQMALKDSDRHSVKEYRNQIYREAAVPPTEYGKRRLRLTHTVH
jgi:mitogen-activated protein kinase 15